MLRQIEKNFIAEMILSGLFFAGKVCGNDLIGFGFGDFFYTKRKMVCEKIAEARTK
jgi:hypothetical protein